MQTRLSPFLLTLWLVLYAKSTFVYAQTDNYVDVNVSAITLSGGIKDLKYESNGAVESLNVFNSVRSETFRYIGPPELTFFRELPPGEGGAEPRRRIVGKMSIPKKSGDFLAVFIKSPSERERYRVKAIPDDVTTFKPGMYRFLNLTPYQIAIQIGETRSVVPRNGYKDVENRGEEGQYQNTVMVSLPKQEGDEQVRPYRVFKGSLFYSSRLRTMYIFTPIEGGRPGRVQFSEIRESL
ncbi:MAG: hypothetical protein AAGJ81_01995 [Verrucomicrobiota bacterium]